MWSVALASTMVSSTTSFPWLDVARCTSMKSGKHFEKVTCALFNFKFVYSWAGRKITKLLIWPLWLRISSNSGHKALGSSYTIHRYLKSVLKWARSAHTAVSSTFVRKRHLRMRKNFRTSMALLHTKRNMFKTFWKIKGMLECKMNRFRLKRSIVIYSLIHALA